MAMKNFNRKSAETQEKTFSYFAGNDYLALANHPEMITAATSALQKYGINFAASRKTTGTSDIHLELEKSLADFKNRDDSIVFASGYLGNDVLLKVLKNQVTAVYTDSMAHPSVLDALPKEITKAESYNHCDANHLENLLRKSPTYRPFIITDGVFALTGEIAPLDQLYSLAKKYNALLVVDDAHSTGILGKNGRGTPEYFNLNDAPNLFQTETMSKALGAYGGFIAADKTVISQIRSTSSFYAASTALPPALVAAGCKAVNLIKKHPEWREILANKSLFLKKKIMEIGFSTTGNPTPIVPLFMSNQLQAKHLSDYLRDNSIIAPSINYPVKMDKSVVRITISVSHTQDQIDKLLWVLKKWAEHNNN